MKNVLDFVKFALSHADPKTAPIGVVYPAKIGSDGVWEYLWGTRGQVCTQALLDSRYKSYYARNGWTREEYDAITAGWVENQIHVTDCEGLLDAFLNKDVTADYNFNRYCTEKGLCAAIDRPYVYGEAVFNGSESKKTHVGWVCGFMKNGEPLVVESRGLAYGVVITRMSKRGWKYRGLMTKVFAYDEPAPAPGEFVFTRILKYGCKGDDVVHLKELLIKDGYSVGITVGTKNSPNFGSATRRNVKNFQRDAGLTVDGVAGKNTITALGGIFQ